MRTSTEELVMQMALYRVVNRELSFQKMIAVPDHVRDLDAWLHDCGYSREYTLRRGIVREITPAEKRALQRETAKLKAAGKLPSAFDRIVGEMTARRA